MPGRDTFCFSVREGAPRRRPRRFAPRANFQLRIHWRGGTLECWFSPARGYSPTTLRRIDRSGFEVVTLFLPVMEQRMRKRTPQATQGSGPEHLAAMETRVFGALPNIIAHCGVVRYEDGTPRQPGWVTVRTLGGAWQVTAKEPDAQCQLVSVANTLDDALAQLDLLLGAEDAPWEVDPWARRQGAKNDKKKG